MQSYYSSWANLLPYVLLIAILLVRPSGLLGRRVRSATSTHNGRSFAPPQAASATLDEML